MSFSETIKNEMCRLDQMKNCCLQSELRGLMKTALGGHQMVFTTENAVVTRRIFMIVKTLYGLTPEIHANKSNKLKKHATYVMDFHKLFENEVFKEVYQGGNDKRCCSRAFIRGAFLAGGSISAPDKTYHLEIATHYEDVAHALIDLLGKFSLNARMIVRKGKWVVYIKEGQEIVDFLNITEAHKSLMKLENVRIIKEMRNNVNRIVNCETANLEKTVNTAVRQLEKIMYIHKTMGFDELPDNLKAIAELRMNHTDVSLKELGQMLNPPLGKSGTNHRLKKLEEIADELREKNEKK